MATASNPLTDPLLAQSGGNVIPADSSTIAEEITQSIEAAKTSGVDFTDLLSDWFTKVIDFGLRVLIALVVFYVFRRVIKWLLRSFKRTMVKRNIDAGLTSFLASILHGLALIVLILLMVDILGFKSVSFAALMAAMGVAIGAALSGQLQNLAAGVVILATRPFRVGDWVIAEGEEGEVKEISIFYTTIISIDQSSVHIPNAVLTSNKVINTSSQLFRRCQWVVTIPYGADVDLAKRTMLSTVEGDARFKDDPAKLIVVRELSENGVRVMLRAYCDNALYWDLLWEIHEKIYKAFQAEQIPFAMRALKLYQGQNEYGSDTHEQPSDDKE